MSAALVISGCLWTSIDVKVSRGLFALLLLTLVLCSSFVHLYTLGPEVFFLRERDTSREAAMRGKKREEERRERRRGEEKEGGGEGREEGKGVKGGSEGEVFYLFKKASGTRITSAVFVVQNSVVTAFVDIYSPLEPLQYSEVS